MTNAEITAALKVDIQAIEAILEHMDEIATPEYREAIPPMDVRTVQNAHRKAVAAVVRLHRAMEAASAQSGDVSIQTGGAGK